MSQTFHGSCLCGALHYRLSSPRAHSLTATAASVARPMARHSPAMAASPSRTCTSTAAPTCSPRSAPHPPCSGASARAAARRCSGRGRRRVRRLGIGRPRQPGHALPGGETEACPGRIDGLLVQDRRRLAAFRLKSARDPPAGACFFAGKARAWGTMPRPSPPVLAAHVRHRAVHRPVPLLRPDVRRHRLPGAEPLRASPAPVVRQPGPAAPGPGLRYRPSRAALPRFRLSQRRPWTSTSRCSTSPDSAAPKRTSAGRTWPASRWTSRWT